MPWDLIGKSGWTWVYSDFKIFLKIYSVHRVDESARNIFLNHIYIMCVLLNTNKNMLRSAKHDFVIDFLENWHMDGQ